LRLGIGQLLRYRHGLTAEGETVRAYLLCERAPSDPAWINLCQDLDVELVWPEILSERVR
jgi:hypothetical protein